MGEVSVDLPMRERLILAGIREINENGVERFSVRRIAADCGVSCAAPYKHFKDKESFFSAIMDYINTLWALKQKDVLEGSEKGLRGKLIDVSVAYIRFLVENPNFRTILTLKSDTFDSEHNCMKGQLSQTSYDLIAAYCASVGMPPKVQTFKTYVVRSLIYGATILFDNGELPYTEEYLAFAAQAIDREFDLD